MEPWELLDVTMASLSVPAWFRAFALYKMEKNMVL